MTLQKIALVTGGNRGIGFEIVRQLAQKSLTVILTARRLADAEYAAQKMATDDMHVIPLKLDVTSEADIKDAAEFIEHRFGRLDILINNSGVLLERSEPMTPDTLRRTYETNVIGPYALTYALLPLLKKSPAGRIVHQSSRLGSLHLNADPEMVDDAWLLPAYNSSKAALNMLTVIQSRQLEKTNIKVNAAHPGWVRTRMGTDDAPLSPADGAKTAIRLALLDENGPTGKLFHGDEELPW